MRLEIPVPAVLAGELIAFWRDLFGDLPDVPPEVLLGDEAHDNDNVLFIRRRADRLAGTCLLTIPTASAAVGSFGEVATRPEFRGSGIATELCARAIDEFRQRGGGVLFLGTGNPDAARIYHRLRWRKLAGADVMANVTSGDPPEAFLVDYFRTPADAITVGPGSPADRVPLVPLLLTPHERHLLDANTGMLSTRYSIQKSCMGLYPRYQAVAADGRGAWFSARTDDSRVVGLATARLDDQGHCRVDGFAHAYHARAWDDLMTAAIAWAAARGACGCYAEVAGEDEGKAALLQDLGFRYVGGGTELKVAGTTMTTQRLEIHT